jgi:hypothetical protein
VTTLTALVDHIALAYKGERRPLANARLTKSVYLVDWYSALKFGEAATPIKWIYNHHGPWVPDVMRCVEAQPARYEVRELPNIWGGTSKVIRLTDSEVEPLAPRERAMLDLVLARTLDMGWDDFIAFVYATYPVASQPRQAALDLPLLAAQMLVDEGAVTEAAGVS